MASSRRQHESDSKLARQAVTIVAIFVGIRRQPSSARSARSQAVGRMTDGYGFPGSGPDPGANGWGTGFAGLRSSDGSANRSRSRPRPGPSSEGSPSPRTLAERQTRLGEELRARQDVGIHVRGRNAYGKATA